MTKEKKSFLERLTGSKKIEEEVEMESPLEITSEENDDSELVMPSGSSFESENDNNWENDGEGQLTIDAYQTSSDIIIKSTIAGVKPEDLEVSINNDVLTIKGERKNEEEVQGDDYYYQECYWGSFSRSIVLPVDVLSDKIDASLKNGILTIKLPKAATDRVKKIQVRGF